MTKEQLVEACAKWMTAKGEMQGYEQGEFFTKYCKSNGIEPSDKDYQMFCTLLNSSRSSNNELEEALGEKSGPKLV